MYRSNFILASFGLAILLSTTAESGIIRVPEDSTTIQEGVNGAVAGDTVDVGPGTYFEHVTVGKEILIKGRYGADSTIISGSGSGSCLTFTNNVGNNCIIRGFKFTNAQYGAELSGGRPLIGHEIDSCIFVGFTSFHII